MRLTNVFHGHGMRCMAAILFKKRSSAAALFRHALTLQYIVLFSSIAPVRPHVMLGSQLQSVLQLAGAWSTCPSGTHMPEAGAYADTMLCGPSTVDHAQSYVPMLLP